jgi:hypothetical protein
MKQEIYDEIAKLARERLNTVKVIRRGLTQSAINLVQTMRGAEYAFMGSIDILERVFSHKIGISVKDFRVLLELYEEAVFSTSEINEVRCVSGSSMWISKMLKSGTIVRYARLKGKKEKVYTISGSTKKTIISFYNCLFRKTKIPLSPDYISPEIENSVSLYSKVAKHNKSIVPFKKMMEQTEYDMKNGTTKTITIKEKIYGKK